MSGFQRQGWFDLTAKKADYWHERCPDHHGQVLELEELWLTHLEPAGFERHPAPSRYMLRLTGPGIAEGSTDPLYQALTRGNTRSW